MQALRLLNSAYTEGDLRHCCMAGPCAQELR